jgi:biopolymer transport protein ExbD
MARRKTNGNDMLAEINITPFTDVVLVLLIIFMVATPVIVGNTVKVNLPKAVTSKFEEQRYLTITIDAKEDVFWEGKKISVDELKGIAALKVKQHPGIQIKIKGDKEIRYKALVKVLDAVRSAGISHYMLAAEKIRQGF